MLINLKFRHFEVTDAIREHIMNKVQKLRHLIPKDASLDWTCTVDGKVQRTDVLLNNHGAQFHASDEDENLYKTIDNVLAKLESQVIKAKKAENTK